MYIRDYLKNSSFIRVDGTMRVKIEILNKKLHLLSSITRHDILNSLTAVIGYLSCAEDENDPGHLNRFIKKSYQIVLLIKELIEFTRYYQDIWVIEPIWQNTRLFSQMQQIISNWET